MKTKLSILIIIIILHNSCSLKRINLVRKQNRLKIDWVLIDKNLQFNMGDVWGDLKYSTLPVHNVKLSPYQISKYEITNKQYCIFLNEAMNQHLITLNNNLVLNRQSDTLLCIGKGQWYWQIEYKNNKFEPVENYENYPVIFVTWYGANEMAKYYNYRLPTEAEWERTARGSGLNNKYSWGNSEPTCKIANYSDDTSSCYNRSLPVGFLKKNITDEGCNDLSGNVWEWCQDYCSFYKSDSVTNPVVTDYYFTKMIRGGSWFYHKRNLRSSFRGYSFGPATYQEDLGFRLVKDIK